MKKHKKDKELEEVVETESNEDKVLDDDDLLPQEIEEKEEEEAKENAKKEKAERKAEKKEYRKEHGVVATFSMYKFIIKILIFAILLVFGILMIIYKDELIGAVYMVSGIIIVFSALIRVIPLIRTTKSKRARLILLIQIIIHLVIGLYLVGAAFYHWDRLKAIEEAIANGNSSLKDLSLKEQLAKISGGKFANFNIEAYAYILVIFFYTFAVGYYWVTILYEEKTNRSLFWLNTIAVTLAVLLGIFAHKLDAQTLVFTLAILAIVSAVVVGGEAGGGYFMYRKKLSASKPKEKKKEKSKDDNIAPGKNDDEEINDIDPNIIPQDEDVNQDSIVM